MSDVLERNTEKVFYESDSKLIRFILSVLNFTYISFIKYVNIISNIALFVFKKQNISKYTF